MSRMPRAADQVQTPPPWPLGPLVVVLALLVALVTGGGIVSAVILAAGHEISVTGDTALLVQLGGELAALGAALGLARMAGSARAIGFHGAGAGAATRQVAPLVLVLTALIIVPVASAGDFIDGSLAARTVALFVTLAVLVGIVEELLFRGVLGWWLRLDRHPWRYVAVSSVAFGMPHLLGGMSGAVLLNAAAVTLLFGVPFAAIFVRSRALLPLIVVHAANDVVAFLHTGSVVPDQQLSVAQIAATLALATGVAAGYVTWLWRALRAPTP